VFRVVNDPAWLPLFVTMVPVSSGKVSVRLVLLLGLAMVNMPVPEASGAREIFDIIYTPVSSAAIRASSASFFAESS